MINQVFLGNGGLAANIDLRQSISLTSRDAVHEPHRRQIEPWRVRVAHLGKEIPLLLGIIQETAATFFDREIVYAALRVEWQYQPSLFVRQGQATNLDGDDRPRIHGYPYRDGVAGGIWSNLV